MAFSKIEAAIAAIQRGEPVVVVDDEGRENEGDLILAAERATPEALAFMIRHTSGVVCVALTGARLAELHLPLMVADNQDSMGTAFTITVDYKPGTSTGISAADRAATVRALASPSVPAADFARPGHIFPLRAREGGVLRRPGHTEAAVDLARLAGLAPAGALCEIVNEDGTMARLPDLERFAAEHRLLLVSIDDLIAYRRRTEKLVEHVADARLPTRHGAFTAHVYRGLLDGVEHVALTVGDVRGAKDVLVRVHSECMTGDLFRSTRCDFGEQLDAAMAAIAAAGRGVVVYLRGHEGRGIGLTAKLHAYNLQDAGRDTVEANLELGLPVDSRRYDLGAQILTDLGLTTIRVMSNNPAKFAALEGYPLRIVERVPLIVGRNAENAAYLDTKAAKLGHSLKVV
jgi:3,4-dihydroxy 2-butanone 4-phosphate synthase/GTP cyclohydrolase II